MCPRPFVTNLTKKKGTMNKLCKIFSSVKSGDKVVLENTVYDVFQDDSILLCDYYCSNTASKEENPNGKRSVAIYLKNKNNVIIDGNGATLKIHGVMTPILLDGCQNVTIKNLTIDYARPTMSEFKILSNENGVVDIYIPSEYLYDIKDNVLIWKGEKGKNKKPYWQHSYKGDDVLSMFYDTETQAVRFCDYSEGDKRPSVPTFSKIEKIDENVLRVTLEDKNAYFPVGNVVQTRNIVRNQVGSFFVKCKNLVLKDVWICYMHGLGLLAQFCDGVTYDGVICAPTNMRTVSSSADFFHFSGCKGGLTVTNCKAIGSHDDFINVHGTHLRIISKNENECVVRFVHTQSWGFDAFFENDTVELIKNDTLLPYFKAKCVKVQKLNDTDVLLVLDKKLPSTVALGKDVVENATYTANLTVKNNYFGVSAGRGVLCTTRGKVVIDGNTFYHNMGASLVIEDDCNFWFESGYTKNVTFTNNTVEYCGYGAKGGGGPIIQVTPQVLNKESQTPVHQKLVIKNNKFLKPNKAKHLFVFKYIKNVTLSQNFFDSPFNIEKFCTNEVCVEENSVQGGNDNAI